METTLRRSWLFLDGADESALKAAASSAADVLIQDLEDFTAPPERPFARSISAEIVRGWKAAGKLAGVRVNRLQDEGRVDLDAIMPGAPDFVCLPKTNEASEIVALDTAVGELESTHRLRAGATGLVPNIEQALGLVNTVAIARASDRIIACLVASEDLAADLGAERSREGSELDYARAKFHADCVAAGVLSVDCPYTWTDTQGLSEDTRKARRLGYKAKSAVKIEHAAVINELLTPSAEEIAAAQRIVEAFETAQAEGLGRVELDGSLVEVPIYLTARRLIARAQAMGVATS